MDLDRLSYAYYDQPELVHRINQDLLDFNLRLLEQIAQTCVPTFMTVAEDMSYNNGPMISKKTFDEFLAPYYRKLLARAKELNLLTIVDTDGDVTMLVPWLQAVGVDGVLPLERQAGVEGDRLRQFYPNLRMVGHYNKLVMHQGDAAIRAEFERLVPLMKTGGFIPSVDHQTPPGVSLEEYRLYVRLLKEYMAAAVR
jgi:uroporphyrinogen-III decarboxylase